MSATLVPWSSISQFITVLLDFVDLQKLNFSFKNNFKYVKLKKTNV